jgi:hypothetical protein
MSSGFGVLPSNVNPACEAQIFTFYQSKRLIDESGPLPVRGLAKVPVNVLSQ